MEELLYLPTNALKFNLYLYHVVTKTHPHLCSNLAYFQQRSFEELNTRLKPLDDRTKKLCLYDIIKFGFVSF